MFGCPLPPLSGLALAVGVYETDRVRRTGLPACEDELPGDRFAGGAVPLLAFLGSVGFPIGISFYEEVIETNGHNISLVFSDLTVDTLEIGHAPFVVHTAGLAPHPLPPS
jgi:hypothetical protein